MVTWIARPLFRFTALGIMLVSVPMPGFAKNWDDLLIPIPAGANTIAVIDVAAVHASPVARKQVWKDEIAKPISEGPISVPSDTTRLVISSLMDIRNLRSVWEIGVMELENLHAMAGLARRENTYVDTLESREAVKTQHGAYITKLSDRQFGIVQPGDRQFVARWLKRQVESKELVLDDYLRRVASFVTTESPLAMGMDLKYIRSDRDVRNRLGNSTTMKSASVDLDAVAKVLSSIQGMSIVVGLGDSVRGTVRFDFSVSPDILAGYVKPLFLEILANHGAALDDVNNWNERISGQTAFLEGELSVDGLKQILSLLESPASAGNLGETKQQQTAPPAKEPSPKEVMAETSKKYYRSIDKIFTDLRNTRGGKPSMYAVWYEKAAAKLDRLPILNVDQDLLNFGVAAAGQLRAVTAAMRGVGMETGVARYNVANTGAGNYGWGWGWNNQYDGAAVALLSVQQSATKSAVEFKNKSWAEIDKYMRELQIGLTQRYGIEF